MCLVVPNSAPPLFVNNQMVSLPPVGIFNKFLFNLETIIGWGFCDIQNNPLKVEVRLRPITLAETFIILDITKTESNNCFIVHWMKKSGSHVFASSLTASNTRRASLTCRLPLVIIKITISSLVIGLKKSYFPLIRLPSCFRTVCYRTVCYWTVCYRKV